MSNVGAENTPPGSWPSPHCESGEGAHGQSAATPRSQPVVPEYHGVDGGNSGGADSHSGEYTHQDPQAMTQGEQKGKGLNDDDAAQQQHQPVEMKDETGTYSAEDQQETIQMKDVEPKPVDETVQRKEDKEETTKGENAPGVEEKEDEGITKNFDAPDVEEKKQHGGEQEPESKTEKAADDVEAPAEAGTTASLTEKAKQAFDQASENRPTTEARDEFLKAVRENLDAPSTADQANSSAGQEDEQHQQQQQQQKAPEVEAPEKTEAEGREKSEVAAPEKTEVEGAEQAAAATEQAPGEDEQQQQQQTSEIEVPEKTDAEAEKAPTEQAEDVPADQEKAALDTQDEKSAETEQQPAPEEAEAAAAKPQTQEQQATSQEPETVEGEPNAAKEEPAIEKGQVEQQEEQKEDSELKPDFSVLKNGTVNKGGNVVSPDKKIVGRVIEGALTHLVGKKVDENGDIWSSSGKVIGKAEPIPDTERDEMFKEPAPFESFPDAVVDKDGMVVNGKGEIIGRVVDGDKSILRGKNVDPDGDILDRGGNVIGKAERWEPEPEKEPEPEPEVDKSILAGKRVNKAGNVVDGNGVIFGRVVEGDVKRMVGRMCDKKGNILSESGDILGRAELVPEGEREGLKEGPFAELQGCTVAKDGTIVTPAGDIVGRLTSGDGKILFGRTVDEDGDILDKNGNVVGHAERWEPEKVERKKNPMSGRKVNREGNVVDEDGNIIGKLTSGDLSICSGKVIDDDGDVVDYKGNTVGHCSLLQDIPVEEPKEDESPEEKEKREQAERDRKLAIQMSVCIEQCLESIRPICKMITEKIERAERTPEDERDEEQLVAEVRPLIEEGGRILNEAKGVIKGLDPDGRLAANAKHKTAAREATPEEYHLADVLKDLTGDVTQCIENAKKKLEGMPHAKKELNPLWGLLNEPLFQILAAVGLLLAGVLNLVGRLLSGLGLGGIIDGLLGTLGLNRVLEGLGLGGLSQGLKGGKKGGGGGGLLGGILGGK